MLPILAKLLSLDETKLLEALTKRVSVTRGETFVTPLNLAQANDGRDAIAKAIYGRMFNWIVNYINDITKHKLVLNFVGVLDIFGFEDFAVCRKREPPFLMFLRSIHLSNSVSISPMSVYNTFSIIIFSSWSKKNIRGKASIGQKLNLLTIKPLFI